MLAARKAWHDVMPISQHDRSKGGALAKEERRQWPSYGLHRNQQNSEVNALQSTPFEQGREGPMTQLL
jgi:hypothetical protein